MPKPRFLANNPRLQAEYNFRMIELGFFYVLFAFVLFFYPHKDLQKTDCHCPATTQQ